VAHLDGISRHDVAWPEGFKAVAAHKGFLKKALLEYERQFGEGDDDDERPDPGAKSSWLVSTALAQSVSCTVLLQVGPTVWNSWRRRS